MLALVIVALLRGLSLQSVCLNTVAMLFLCDIDNVAFQLGLSEKLRSRVESAGRITLTEDNITAIARSKAVHAALIVICVLGWVLLCGEMATNGGFGLHLITGIPFLPFAIGGIVDATMLPEASTGAAKLRGVGAAVAQWLLGWVVYVMIIILAAL